MPNTREKLIELLETVVSPKEVLCDGEVLVSTAKVADHLIANGVVVSKTETATIATDNPVGDKWIPVTERLPDADTRVLVYLRDGYGGNAMIDTDRLHNGRWVRWNKFITHWMPLPEPPEGE